MAYLYENGEKIWISDCETNDRFADFCISRGYQPADEDEERAIKKEYREHLKEAQGGPN